MYEMMMLLLITVLFFQSNWKILLALVKYKIISIKMGELLHSILKFS